MCHLLHALVHRSFYSRVRNEPTQVCKEWKVPLRLATAYGPTTPLFAAGLLAFYFFVLHKVCMIFLIFEKIIRDKQIEIKLCKFGICAITPAVKCR